MISRGLLSKEQFEYYSSQKDTITNLSENNKRIAVTVEKIFDTLPIILDSKRIDQELKDKMFNPSKVSLFINHLTQNNPESTNAQEVNKQEIILDLIQKVFSYYQSRYKDEKFVIKEIMKFQQLAQDLKEVAENEKREDEASIMYKTRKMPYPPILFPERDNWTALCMQCYSYSTIGNNDSESIKHIRHAKNCSFHKEWKRFARKDRERVIQQFFKIIPPLKKPKKVS